MTPNGDVIQSSVIFGGSSPRTEKTNGTIGFLGTFYIRNRSLFFKIKHFKIWHFWHDWPDLVSWLTQTDLIARKPSPLYSTCKIAHKTCAASLIFVFYVWWPFVTWSWPWTELSIKHLLKQYLALYFRSIRSNFWHKTDNFEVSTARNPKGKPRFWPLTWPWPDTWPHLGNLGGALGSTHRELSNAASLVSLRPFVRELWRGGV